MKTIKYQYSIYQLNVLENDLDTYCQLVCLNHILFVPITKYYVKDDQIFIWYNLTNKLCYSQVVDYNLRFKYCCILGLVNNIIQSHPFFESDYNLHNIVFDYMGNCYLLKRGYKIGINNNGQKIETIKWVFLNLVCKYKESKEPFKSLKVPKCYQEIVHFTTLDQWYQFLNNLLEKIDK